MSDTIKQDRSPIKVAYSTGGVGVSPIPEHISPKSLLSSQTVNLYHPLKPGPDFTIKRTELLKYKDLAQAIALDGDPGKINEGSRDIEMRKLFNTINTVAATFWPVAKNMYIRQVNAPKRDMKYKNNITPDIGVTVAPPTRKIEGPKVRNSPPRPM